MIVLLIFATFSVVAAQPENLPKNFSHGNNLFTASIYKEVSKNGTGNILVSPLSAEIVLALVQSGAKDDTKEELKSSLHLLSTEEEIRSSFKTLLTKLTSNENYKLYTANKAYVKKDLPVKEAFKRVANEVYQADLENIDFSRKKEAADVINQWVEQHTENKIHDLVDPDNLDENTALILVNALYFRGQWFHLFDKKLTRKDTFYKSNNELVDVDTMHIHRELYEYSQNIKLKAKFLRIRFLEYKISMVIVLPDEKEGLADLENKIDEVFISREFPLRMINLALPKFKIQNKINFKEILEKIGVKKAFSNEADFSDIFGNKGDLYISDVIQKTFIDVNEEGVEVAAATEVDLGLGAALAIPIEFKVDHPFIYYIQYEDFILFAGRVTDPSY